MASTGITIKFKIFSVEDTYFIVGSSSKDSFNKRLGTGQELLGARSSAGIENGIEVFSTVDLDGSFGQYNIRLYAENNLGIRSRYNEKLFQVMGSELGDKTFAFADVFSSDSEITARSKTGTIFEDGNQTNITLNFHGNSPTVSWSLFAPPGHPLEGQRIGVNNSFDRLLSGFDVKLYRIDGSGDFELITSDSDVSRISDHFPDWDYNDSDQCWFIGFNFSIDFAQEIFEFIAGDNDRRQIKLEIRARTITFAADTQERTCKLNLILQNEKTKLHSKFVNTIKNDFYFSFEVDDIDFNRLEVVQYKRSGGSSSSWLENSKKVFEQAGAVNKNSGSIIVSQEWSNGRDDAHTNEYQYLIRVYDSFGISSEYAPLAAGGVGELTVPFVVGDAAYRTYEAVVKIDTVIIEPVEDKFNINWNLEDTNGNAVIFSQEEIDNTSVIKGIVGYFSSGNPANGIIVDAFRVTDVIDGKRFSSPGIDKSNLIESELKQETFVSSINEITKVENARIQTTLSGTSSEASRTLHFTLAIIDGAGKVIDEKTVSGTNAAPEISSDGFTFDPNIEIGSISFDFQFNEKVDRVEIYRRPVLVPNSPTSEYAQKSATGQGTGEYSLSNNTETTNLYNNTSSGIKYGSGNFQDNLHLVKTQRFKESEEGVLDGDDTTIDSATKTALTGQRVSVIDRNVPLFRRDTTGSGSTIDLQTEYDYIILPYDSFGAGIPFKTEDKFQGTKPHALSYALFDKNDRGFVGRLNVTPPSKPQNLTVEKSFNNWFLDWDPSASGDRAASYLVTAIIDKRTAQDRGGVESSINTTGQNEAYQKYFKQIDGAVDNSTLRTATAIKADGSTSAVTVQEETDHPNKRISDHISEIDLESDNTLSISTADIDVVQFTCNTTTLQIEGQTNQAASFIIEAIDGTGNHSELLADLQFHRLGQANVTELASFEQEITDKLPGAVVLVPSNPFKIDSADPADIKLDWVNHFIYKDGESQYIESGSISLNKELFVGTDATGTDAEIEKANADRYIKYVYWNPEGGYDTSDNTFKKSVEHSNEQNAWEKVAAVDQNITYKKEGYYSFSMFNPSGAIYNTKDDTAPTISPALLSTTTKLSHTDYFGDPNPSKQELDLTIFNNSSSWKNYAKYDGTNTSTLVKDVIRNNLGIHIPIEAEGENGSHGKRLPLVKSNSTKNTTNQTCGSVVIARINKIEGDYSVTAAWHSFANAVIGTAMIEEASIKSAMINDLTADTITGGKIQGHEIILTNKATENTSHSETIPTGLNSGSKNFADYGLIKSDGFMGAAGGVAGFYINGNGEFEFATQTADGRVSSLGFENGELVLRGRLDQPEGTPGATLSLSQSADTVVFDEFRTEGSPEKDTIVSPSSQTITITGAASNAFIPGVGVMSPSNIGVKIYPENLKNATFVNDPLNQTAPDGDYFYETLIKTQSGAGYSGIFDISDLAEADNLNSGTFSFDVEFANGADQHKFLINERVNNTNNVRIAEFFTVEVELKLSASDIKYKPGRAYSEGAYASDTAGANVYQADKATTQEPSASASDWTLQAGVIDINVITQKIRINSFIEPSSAIVYQLVGSPSSQVQQTLGVDEIGSTIKLKATYGTEAQIDLDSELTAISEQWALNIADNIQVWRKIKTVDGVTARASGPWEQGEVRSISNTEKYISLVGGNNAAVTDTTKWAELDEFLKIGEYDTDRIKYTSSRNVVKRHLFGVNKIVSRQIMFEARYYTTPTVYSVIAEETVDLLEAGVNSGSIKFYSDAARTIEISSISRGISGDNTNRKLNVINTTVYARAIFSSGNQTEVSRVDVEFNISAGQGEVISNVTPSDANLLTLQFNNDADISVITAIITNNTSDAQASAKSEIAIINEVDTPRTLRVIVPRQFIYFSREEGSTKANISRPENILPFQVLFGNEPAEINSDDSLTIVPSYGRVVNGQLLCQILKADTGITGSADANLNNGVIYGSFSVPDRELITISDNFYPTSKSDAMAYEIYNVGGGIKFKDAGGAEIDVLSSEEYYYLIPGSASGADAASRVGKVSIKANLKVNDAGISGTELEHQDIQPFTIAETAIDGKEPLLADSSNSSLTASGNESGRIESAPTGEGSINVFRGNQRVPLPPKSITINGTQYDLDLDELQQSSGTLQYEVNGSSGSMSSSSSAQIDFAGNTSVSATVNSFAKIIDSVSGLNRIVIESASTGSVSGDQSRRKVVIGTGASSSFTKKASFFLSWSHQSVNYSLSENDFIIPPANDNTNPSTITSIPSNVNFDSATSSTSSAAAANADPNSKPQVSMFHGGLTLLSKIDASGMSGLNPIRAGADTINFAAFNFNFDVYVTSQGIKRSMTVARTIDVSQQGQPGPSFVFRGGWSANETYSGTEVSQDVVEFHNGKYFYLSREAGTVIGTGTPSQNETLSIPEEQGSLWQETNSLQPTATSLLLANDIFIKKGLVVGIGDDTSATAGASGFVASQLEPRFLATDIRGNLPRSTDFAASVSGTAASENSQIDVNTFDGSTWIDEDYLVRSAEDGVTSKRPGDRLPGFFLGSHPRSFDTTANGTKTFRVAQLEMRSPFGNFLRWDGKNLTVKGAIINASVKDDNFKQKRASSTLLTLETSNPQIGPQTFIGGGFNNTIDQAGFKTLGSSIVGGAQNAIGSSEATTARFSSIGGGYGNSVAENFSTISGGYFNSIGVTRLDDSANPGGINTITGGSTNSIEKSSYSFIGSGFSNSISKSMFGSILNGYNNFIGGGESTSITTVANDTSPIFVQGFVFVEGKGYVDVFTFSSTTTASITDEERYELYLKSIHQSDENETNDIIAEIILERKLADTIPTLASMLGDGSLFEIEGVKFEINLGFDTNNNTKENENNAFNPFNNLTYAGNNNTGGILFNTGYFDGNDNEIHVRVKYSDAASTSGVGFREVLMGSGGTLRAVKISTLSWPYVKINGKPDQYVFKKKTENGKDRLVLCTDVVGASGLSMSKNTSSFESVFAGGDDSYSSQNTPSVTKAQITTQLPDPDDTLNEFAFNSIIGGDYNSIIASKRSTIVGGRNNSVKYAERAVCGGINNIINGEQKLASEDLLKGFVVFGRDNRAYASYSNYPSFTDSYETNLGGTAPTNLTNVILGADNFIRNSSKTTVMGSNNEMNILRSDGVNYSILTNISAEEVTIIGTDNKIRLPDEDTHISNLGIFGTNFTLTEPEMVQNTFYIGNPANETTDIGKLTRIFIAADGGAFFTGDVISFALSDKKYKTNIKNITNPIEKVNRISGVSFDWKDNQSIYKGRDVGVIAQELQEVMPELVEEGKVGLRVKYEKITPLLIESIKDQQKKIEYLEDKIMELSSAIDKLK